MTLEDEVRALREALRTVEVERDHFKDLAKDLLDKVEVLKNDIDWYEFENKLKEDEV